MRWAALEASRRHLPLRLVIAYSWPAGGLVGKIGLGVDPHVVLRDVAVGHLAAAADLAAGAAPGVDVDRVDVVGFAMPVLQA